MGNTIVCNQCEQPTIENKNQNNRSLNTQFGSKKEKIHTAFGREQKSWEGPAVRHIQISDGINEILYTDGSFYKEQTVNKMRHGKGIQHLEGIQYQGMWQHDKAQGKGVLKAKNFEFQCLFQANHIMKGKMKIFKGKITEIYEGEFREFKYHGKGVLNIVGQSRYEGEFKNHKKEGKGKIVYQNGSSYEGEFKNGMMCGYGTYRSMQFQYTGEFVDNRINGKGVCRKNKVINENEMFSQNDMTDTTLSQKLIIFKSQEKITDTNNFTFAKPKLRA